ncbi:MAG: DUF305 domain-containing protein [Sporichthyaceae bacterium]
MLRSRSAGLALTTALSLGSLAACGGGEDTATTAPPAADAAFNSVDVAFAQQMIPHHSQAVKMAALADTRAKSPKVKKLAEEILFAQGPEIETMQGFLDTWKQPSGPDMASMDHSSMSPEEMAAMGPGAMPGMATDEDLAKLGAAKGAAFDKLFLAMMLEHHRAAVEMAKAQRADGKASEALALAEDVESNQADEIAEIRKLQKAG